ncbi:MAG: sensor histidine kinase [Clostridia bacterium]|nr:sensor histidine kinase [Clostridia bacterium]
MRQLSENILDITMNSVRAGASLISVILTEDPPMLTITIADNGCGMSAEFLEKVVDPFCTTRTTRKVGLGIPFFKMEAEQTGGSFSIESTPNVGTTVTASFDQSSIDALPLGDMPETVMTLISSGPDRDFLFLHTRPQGEIRLDTRELREQLGDLPLDTPEVLLWVRDYLREQYGENDPDRSVPNQS